MKKLPLISLFILHAVNADPVAYKVERVIYPQNGIYEENAIHQYKPLAQIEIGATEHRPKKLKLPSREIFNSSILIGTQGITQNTTFYEFEKRCEYLCGDEIEECHFTGLIHWENQDIGHPLVALTGIEGEIDNFMIYDENNSPITTNIPKIELYNEEMIWPTENYLGLITKGNKTTFSYGFGKMTSVRFNFEAPDCKWIEYDKTDIARLSCNSAEALLHKKIPLLYSHADYNISNVQLINSFTINNQWYYTIRLALKAYTAFGVLTHDGTGWKFIVKPADWASLC